MQAVKEELRRGHRRLTHVQQAKALALVLREEFDSLFHFFLSNANGPTLVEGLEQSGPACGPDDWTLASRFDPTERNKVVALSDCRYGLCLAFPEEETAPLVAVGIVAGTSRDRAGSDLEQARLRKWLRLAHQRLLADNYTEPDGRRDAEQEGQPAVVWEAVMSLDRLLNAVRIHKNSDKDRQRILRVANDLLGFQVLIWLPAQAEDGVLFEGERLLSQWDCQQLANHLASSPSWEKSGYFLCNDVVELNWGPRFAQVVNMLAVPVVEKKTAGWVIALNKSDPRERKIVQGHGPEGRPLLKGGELPRVKTIRRGDAALLMPFVSLLGMHSRSAQRYHQLRDLMVGLTRSLTAAIDAKDAYTYGHSERVARIAVELGRELGLAEDELSDIYLAGLLHDIGKIGVQDSILCKREPLTPEEMRHIQQHVTIGYRILAGLHPIAHLLPGVLYHHERYDGGGYPEGLKGDSIPFLARILAVADSYDAMSTSRPYRNALPAEKVDAILKEGAGVQWDQRVVQSYTRRRDKILAIRQRGVGESLRDALDGALRNGDRDLARSSLVFGL